MIIDDDKMIAVLTDIHVAEAAAQSLRREQKDSILSLYYEQVFYIHQISREEFERTMLVLRGDPDHLENLYNKILEELTEKSAGVK